MAVGAAWDDGHGLQMAAAMLTGLGLLCGVLLYANRKPHIKIWSSLEDPRSSSHLSLLWPHANTHDQGPVVGLRVLAGDVALDVYAPGPWEFVEEVRFAVGEVRPQRDGRLVTCPD